MTLDTDLIRRRRVEVGLSHRAVAAALGVSAAVIKGIEKGTNHADLTVSHLTRLADVLAVDLADLITRPEPAGPNQEDRSPTDDAAVVGSLLAATGVLTPTTALADATGWPLARIHDALDTLADRLPATGHRLRRHQSLVAIGRTVTPGDAERIKTALRIHLARDGVSASEVRTLRRIHAGTLPKALGNADTVSLGVVANAQLIATADDGAWQLADDVRYSLLLD